MGWHSPFTHSIWSIGPQQPDPHDTPTRPSFEHVGADGSAPASA
jgi:hypothetical protein